MINESWKTMISKSATVMVLWDNVKGRKVRNVIDESIPSYAMYGEERERESVCVLCVCVENRKEPQCYA